MTVARQDIPYAFERRVYDDHGPAIEAAVHEVMPDEHDGRLCDAICASVAHMVVALLYDADVRTPSGPTTPGGVS